MLLLKVNPLIGCLALVEVMKRMAAESDSTQRRQGRLDQVDRAHEGELMRSLPRLVVEVCEEGSRWTAGVDDQCVEPPEFAHAALDGDPGLLGVCDIRGGCDDADAMRAHRVGGLLQCRVRARAHAHVSALGGEVFGDGTPHALARRRHERGASAEPEIHGWDPSSLPQRVGKDVLRLSVCAGRMRPLATHTGS